MKLDWHWCRLRPSALAVQFELRRAGYALSLLHGAYVAPPPPLQSPPPPGRLSLHCFAGQYLLRWFVLPICHTHVLALCIILGGAASCKRGWGYGRFTPPFLLRLDGQVPFSSSSGTVR